MFLGFQPGIYPMEELKADYKRGLVVAISFCVFVMPLLLPKIVDANRINLFDKEERRENSDEGSLNKENRANEVVSKAETNLHHQDSVDNGNFPSESLNDDVVDGPIDKQFSPPSASFPNFAKERLIDGIKEVLEEQTKSSMHRVASMDYQTSL